MADGTITVKAEEGKITPFTLAGVYLQLEDLDRLLSDHVMSHASRLAQGIVSVRAMKADVRKRIEEGRRAEVISAITGEGKALVKPEAMATLLGIHLASDIFHFGEKADRPITRIQYKSGKYPEGERDEGGLCESALSGVIAAALLRRVDADTLSKAQVAP